MTNEGTESVTKAGDFLTSRDSQGVKCNNLFADCLLFVKNKFTREDEKELYSLLNCISIRSW